MTLIEKKRFGVHNVIKTIGNILVFSGCLIWGFIYAARFKDRTKELKELEICISQLQNEMMYSYTLMPEILINISKKTIHPINKVFKEIANILYENEVNSVYEAFYIAFKNNDEILSLNKEDIKIILDLSKALGQSDLEGQKKMIDLSLYNLKNQCKKAEEKMIKSVKMYRYLGFTIGATLVIIFI